MCRMFQKCDPNFSTVVWALCVCIDDGKKDYIKMKCKLQPWKCKKFKYLLLHTYKDKYIGT